MKRLLGFGLSAVVLMISACNGTGTTTASTSSNGDNKDSLHQGMLDANRAVQHAIETGDTAILRKYIAADATDHGGGPNGEDVKGEDIIRMLADFHNSIDNMKFETLQEAANDDHIFALVRMTGTTKKAVFGMPANYKMDNRSVDVIKIKNGQMVDHWAFVDPAEMMKMMGGGKPAGDMKPAADATKKNE